MVCIYCITDWNSLNYIGSTTQKLPRRLNQHRAKSRFKNGKVCSSEKLDLYNCIIYRLETCSEEERTDKEKYWINKYPCVNTLRYDFDYQRKLKQNREWKKRNRV